MMGRSPRCYIPSFVKIGPPVLEKKIFKFFIIYGRGGHLGAPSKYRKPPQTTANHPKPHFLYMITVERGGNGCEIATIRAPLAFKYASVGLEDSGKCYRRTRCISFYIHIGYLLVVTSPLVAPTRVVLITVRCQQETIG